MKNHTRYILLACLILLSQATLSKPEVQYGLSFQSYEVKKEQRTSLNLTSEGRFSFSDGFALEFDLLFREKTYNFGYVARIIGDNEEHVDLLLSTNTVGSIPNITAIYRSGEIICNSTFDMLDVAFDQWNQIKMFFDCRTGLFRLSINGHDFEMTNEYFRKFTTVDVIFGLCKSINFQVSDVPNMSVKDILIKDMKEKPVYHWKLSQHTTNGVYDELRRQFAACEYPHWIIDSHCSWQKSGTFTTGINPQLCFGPQDNAVTVIDKQTFYSYDPQHGTLSKASFDRGFPSGSNANQLLYNPLSRHFFTYDFQHPIAEYDPLSRSWSNHPNTPASPYYWHHNRFFSLADSTLYTFGGYGFLQYKNDINTYHLPTQTWGQAPFEGEEKILPRYLSGLGAIDQQTVLIFGGYGNKEGKQELSPHNYYDLYTYDTKTSTARKLWELDANQHNFVVANSLVVDTLGRCFYALCFPNQQYDTHMQLYRFSLDRPEYEVLADSIPFSFNDNLSYADLYLSSDSTLLVAVTACTNSNVQEATISVYTLAYPPLSRTDIFQHEAGNGYLIYIGGAILAVGILGFVYIRIRSKKKAARFDDDESVPEEEGTPRVILSDKPRYDAPSRQVIRLFGGFQVLDKESKNITGEFAPILKQLFLLILLYTLKDGKGISTVKLREILWFDKSDESAKNNRGVSMSKLRVIFEKVGEVTISGQSSYWTTHFGQDIFCDYYEALLLMDRLSTAPNIPDLRKLVAIVSAGELLPNVQTEWVDPFKSSFSNRLIDFLLNTLDNATALKLSQSFRVEIADAIFVHDSLNEDALKIKCSLLVEMGKNGLARKTYLSFEKEYQSLFGSDFKYTFEQIIS